MCPGLIIPNLKLSIRLCLCVSSPLLAQMVHPRRLLYNSIVTSFVISCAQSQRLRLILPFKQSHTMRTLSPKKNNPIIHYRINIVPGPIMGNVFLASLLGFFLPSAGLPVEDLAHNRSGLLFLFFPSADTNILRGFEDAPSDEPSTASVPQRSAAISQAVHVRVTRTTSISSRA